MDSDSALIRDFVAHMAAHTKGIGRITESRDSPIDNATRTEFLVENCSAPFNYRTLADLANDFFISERRGAGDLTVSTPHLGLMVYSSRLHNPLHYYTLTLKADFPQFSGTLFTVSS